MRTKEALALRRAEGVTLGRRKGSCVKQQILTKNRDEIAQRLEQGHTIAAIRKTYGVSRDTFRVFRSQDSLTNNPCTTQ